MVFTRCLWVFAVLLAASPGCQWGLRNRLAAIESQNRALSEQNWAQLAEIENLRSANQRLVTDKIDGEKDRAALVAQTGSDRRRLANYQSEREALQDQFDGVAHGSSAMPSRFRARLANLARRYPSLQFDEQTGISKLDTDVLFDTGRAELKPESQKMLREFAGLFREPEAKELKIMIVGHTDNQLVAKKPARDLYSNNFHLSTAQSLAVADFLRQVGLSEDRMGVSGYAQHQPITPNSTAADRQRNRRVEIFVVGPETPVVGWTETIPNLY